MAIQYVVVKISNPSHIHPNWICNSKLEADGLLDLLQCGSNISLYAIYPYNAEMKQIIQH